MGKNQAEKRFGSIAVEKGFITVDQLIEGLEIQIKEELEKGDHRPIGAILYFEGRLSIPQIDEVLTLQGNSPCEARLKS
jgi:hypothetical protein